MEVLIFFPCFLYILRYELIQSIKLVGEPFTWYTDPGHGIPVMLACTVTFDKGMRTFFNLCASSRHVSAVVNK